MRFRETVSKIRDRVGWKWPAVGAALIIGGLLFVWHFVTESGFSEPGVSSVEESWNATINSLRVIPIFPPEEDIAVGDIFATVVADDDPDSTIVESQRKVRKSFIGRSVKLAHIAGVIDELENAYKPIPVFPTSEETRDHVVRRFKDGVTQSNLPRAAFPRLKIEGIDTAGAGVSAENSAGVSYLANKKQYAEFELSDVRTYGLPIVLAENLLKAYCMDDSTKDVCTEPTARKHLRRIVGERTLVKTANQDAPRSWWIDECFINKRGQYEFSIKVEIAMVYRVYLTNSSQTYLKF